MIVLIAKLSLSVGLPIAAAVVWQSRTQARWSSLFFAFVAFAVNYLVQLLLDKRVSQFLEHDVFFPIIVFFAVHLGGIYFPWILN